MAKFFGNLHLVLATGLVFAIVSLSPSRAGPARTPKPSANAVLRWLHLFFGVLWIGLLYYLNFVQVPTMPKVPAELKKGVTGYIAPSVLFFFRWGAAFTVLTGLSIAYATATASGDGLPGHRRRRHQPDRHRHVAGCHHGRERVVRDLAGAEEDPRLVEASDEAKAKAAPVALIASRTNVILSLPMFYAMVSANMG
jgi:uncharacterized membrane protein